MIHRSLPFLIVLVIIINLMSSDGMLFARFFVVCFMLGGQKVGLDGTGLGESGRESRT